MKQILIIGYLWVEETTGAGNRMMQLIEQFQQQGWKIIFASAAQKTSNSIDLSLLKIKEVAIELNASSFDDFIKNLQPEIVLFDRFMIEEQFGWRVAENSPNSLRILDTEDLHFLRKTRHQQLKKGEEFNKKALFKAEITKREIASILRCDLSLIISSYEIQLLKEVFKIDERILCHLPFLFSKITEKELHNWASFNARNHFVFIGNFLHKPNVDAVLTLKKYIWKSLKQRLPKAELHIYGAYVTQQIQELHHKKEGFLIKGYAQNPKKIVENAKMVLAPLRFGAGVKGKLTEAMICGTPSVTTKIGAEGMHDTLPWNGYVTDNYADFIQKAHHLYTDEVAWKAAQKNGVTIINHLYNKEKLGLFFIKKITDTLQNMKAHRNANFLGSLLQHNTLQATKYMSKWIEEKNKRSDN